MLSLARLAVATRSRYGTRPRRHASTSAALSQPTPIRTSTGVTTCRADSADVAATAICRSTLARLAGFTGGYRLRAGGAGNSVDAPVGDAACRVEPLLALLPATRAVGDVACQQGRQARRCCRRPVSGTAGVV